MKKEKILYKGHEYEVINKTVEHFGKSSINYFLTDITSLKPLPKWLPYYFNKKIYLGKHKIIKKRLYLYQYVVYDEKTDSYNTGDLIAGYDTEKVEIL